MSIGQLLTHKWGSPILFGAAQPSREQSYNIFVVHILLYASGVGDPEKEKK